MSSNNVDNRVVRMEFDNEQFEAGVQQTLASLEELKESLKFNNSLTGINAITSAVNSFSLANISEQVETLANRFSTLGIVGMTAIQNITNKVMNLATGKITSVISQIQTGGWNRASSIAQSRFTLEGMLDSADKVDEAFESASKAVDGTAYSLDAAVSAAAQLATTGVDTGEDMENALQAVAGVAATTGAAFDDIANIFVDVSSAGKVTGDTLTRLSYRGVNAKEILGSALGKTSEEIKDMASKGEISFKQFSDAMQDTFGEHAKDANKTFSGSMANIKSALSRIGAIFASGIIENDDLINSLNDVRKTINAIKTAMLPLEDKFKNLVSAVSKAFSSIIGEFNVEPIENFVDILGRGMDTVSGLINRWTKFNESLKDSILGETAEKVEATADQIARANEYVEKANEIWEKGMYGVGEVRKELLGDDYEPIQKIVNQRAKGITDLSEIAIQTVVDYDNSLKEANETVDETGQKVEQVQKKIFPIGRLILAFKSYLGGIKTIVGNIKTTVLKAYGSFKKVFNIDKLIQDISDYGNMFSEFFSHFELNEERSNKLERALTGLWSALDLLRSVIKAVAGGLSKTLGPVLSVILDVFLTIFATVGDMITRFNQWYQENDLLKGIFETLGNVISTVVDYVTTFFEKLNQLPAVQKIKEELGKLADLIGEKLLGYFGDAKEAVDDFFGKLDEADENPKMQTLLDNINEGLENIIEFATDAKENYGKFIDWINGKATDLNEAAGEADNLSGKIENIKKAGKSLVEGEGVSAFLDNMGKVFGDFGDKVDGFIDWIIEKFNSLDATKMALIGFGTMLTTMGLSFSYLSWNLGNFVKSFTSIPDQISGTIKSVKGVFKSMSEYIKNDSQAKLIKAYAIAIGVLAVALVALTFVDQEKLTNATTCLGSLMVIMLVTVGIIGLVASKAKDFKSVMSVMYSMSVVLLAIATSALILASALKTLSELDYTKDKWWMPLVILTGIIAALVGVCIILNKYSGQLTYGALSMVTIGAAVWLVAKAMTELNKVETNGLAERVDALTDILWAVAGVFAVMKIVSRFGGSVNTLSVLAMIASVWLIEIALMDIMFYGVTMDDIKQNLDKFYPVLISLGIIVAAVSLMGLACKGATKMAGTILAFTISVLALIFALKLLSDIAQNGELGVGMVALCGIFIQMFTLMFVLDKVTKVAKGIGKELINITIAVGILALICYLLKDVDIAEFQDGVLLCYYAVALVGALALVTRVAKNVDYKTLYAMVVALGVVTVAITLMSLIPDKMALLQSAGILGLALISLGAALYLASEWAGQISIKSIIAMVLMVSMVTSALFLLTNDNNGDYKNVLAAALALTVVFLSLGVMLYAMGEVFKENNGVSITKPRLKLFAEMIVAIGVVAGSLALLTHAMNGNTDTIGAAVVAIIVVMATVMTAVAVLADNMSKTKIDNSILTLVGLAMGVLFIVAVSLSLLMTVIEATSMDALYGAIGGLTAVIVVVGLCFAAIGKYAKTISTQTVVAFGLMIGVLAAAAGSLWLVLGTGAKWYEMLSAAGAMVLVIAAVAAALAVLTKIGEGGTTLLVMVVVAAALSATMLALGFSMKMAAAAIVLIVEALKELGNVPWDILEANLGNMVKLVGIMAAISVISLVFGAGLTLIGVGLTAVGVGVLVITASIVILATTFMMVVKTVTQFIVALDNLINTFKTSKGEISSGISEIGTGLANGITNFVQILADNADTIADCIFTLLESLLARFIIFRNKVAIEIAVGILSFLEIIDTYAPRIVTKATDTLIDILSSLAQNAGKVATLGAIFVSSLIVGIFQGLSQKIGDILGAAMALAISFIYGVADTIYENTQPLIDAMKYLGLVLVRELIAAFNIGGVFNDALAEIDGEIEYQKDLRKEQGEETTEAFNEGVEEAGEAEAPSIDTSQSEKDAEKSGEKVGESYSNSAIDAIKDKINGVTSGGGSSLSLDNITDYFTNGGEDAGFSFGSSFNQGISESKIDASSIPTSVKEQLLDQGYEQDGQYLVKDIETGINESDLDISNFENTVYDELPSTDDMYDNGEDLKDNWIDGYTNITEEDKAKIWHAYSGVTNLSIEAGAAGQDSSSPSKKSRKLGNYWAEGFIIGGEELADKIYSTYSGITSTTCEEAANMVASISKIVQDDSIDWTPTIVPVIDDSQLQNGSNLLTNTFGNSALNMAANTALSVNDASANTLASQVAALSEQVEKLAGTDYSKILEGVAINVDASTNVDGTPLKKMSSNYTIKQIDTQQKTYNLSRGARA